MKYRFIHAIVFMAILGGCTVGPNYRRPKVALPLQWHENNCQPNQMSLDTRSLTNWWKTFEDPILDYLICQALESNLDIKLATARIKEAKARYCADESRLWPELDVNPSYTRSQNSQNGIFGPLFPRYDTLYQVSFDVTWELDIFGGIRRSNEANCAELHAVIEDRRAVFVSLLGEIARNYAILRGAQEQLKIAVNNVAIQSSSLQIVEGRLNAGLGTDLNVAQAEALLETTRSDIPEFQITIQQAIHRISILLGFEPNALLCLLCPENALPSTPCQIPAGLPSQLLCRRPDIREAERKLAAATARIGVAVADLYPKFNLTGTSFGFQSTQLSNFLNTQSSFWNFEVNLMQYIFDAGRRCANIEIAKAQTQEACIEYRQSILAALQEVEDALTAYFKEQSRVHVLEKAVAANERAFKDSQVLFESGLVDYLNVISAEEDLYYSQNELAISRTSLILDLVLVYKALGGGWECKF